MKTYTHAIVYCGEPYGIGEEGHIVSRHKSLANAEKRFDREFSGNTGRLNHKIVELTEDAK